MFVVLVGSVLTTLVLVRDIAGGAAASASRCRSRSGSGSPCSSRTSPRRWPRGAARRRRTRCARRARRRTAKRLDASAIGTPRSTASVRRRPAPALRRGDLVLCTPGDVIPGDGEVVEGVASVDESAITGESAPVIRESRRRSLGGHRRHEGAVRLSRHPHHGEPRRDVPRSDDRARRRRVAAEDAERDRADDPAVGADDHLPVRRRHAAAVRGLQRRRRRRSRCSSRCSSASFRRRSAACSRPSASPAWIA